MTKTKTSEELQTKVTQLVTSIESAYHIFKNDNESKVFKSIKNKIKNIKDYQSAIEIFQNEFSREMERITSTDATLFKRRIPEHKMEHYIALLNKEPDNLHYPRLIALGMLELYEDKLQEKKGKHDKRRNETHQNLLSLQLPDHYIAPHHSQEDIEQMNLSNAIPLAKQAKESANQTNHKDIPIHSIKPK